MKVTVLGLGLIGAAWAKNLIEDGHDVRTWNRTPKEFPGFQSDLRQAVAGAEAIFLVVADPPAVESVLSRIKPELGPGQLIIQSSTISAKWTRKFAAEVNETGALFLEAPFTGSRPAAEARKTVFYLGGESALIEKARPLLQPLASSILHIGPLGSASSLKLAMNLNIAGVAQALCESITLCRAEGISDHTYFEALKINASRSPMADLKEPKLRAHDYSPQFSVKHMDKDLRLALETAAEAGVSLPQTGNLKRTIYEAGVAAGLTEDDFIGLIRVIETQAAKS